MISRLRQWPSIATLTSALMLSACAGGAGPSAPNATGFGQAGRAGLLGSYQPHIANTNAQPNTSCPTRFVECVTVSVKTGAELIWCWGPESDPCGDSDAGKVKWSGIVCTAQGSTCKAPIKQLTASWSGPYKCKPSDKCKGTFELDTLKPGPGLKETSKYVYKQDIHVCTSKSDCENEYIGINVGS